MRDEGLQAGRRDGLQQRLGGGEVAVVGGHAHPGEAGDVVELQRSAVVDELPGDGDDPLPVAGGVLALWCRQPVLRRLYADLPADGPAAVMGDSGADGPEHPEASPMHGPLDHLGAVTVFTGTRDLLNPDAHRFRELAARASGTTVTLHEFPDMIHDWMLMPMPEAKTVMSTLTTLLS